MWTPLGDCPLELGPLAVVEGSHKVGKVVDHHFSLGAGGQKVTEPEKRGIPRCNDFEIGDTLIFGCLDGAPARCPTSPRTGCACRWTTATSSTACRCRKTSSSRTWSTALPGKRCTRTGPVDDPLKYYWRSSQFDVIAQETRFGEAAFAEALELAEEGDAHAIVHLKRAVAETNSEAVEKAQRVLEKIGVLEAAPGA